MNRFFKSEFLKLKNSENSFISIFILISLCLFSFFLMGYVNFFYSTIFWWENIFFLILISLLIYSDKKREKKAGNYQNIINGNIKKLFFSKVFVCILYSAIINYILFLGIFLISDYLNINYTNFTITFLGATFIWINIIWVIPFIYLVSEYINQVLLFLINFLICIFIAPFIANSKFYFVFPYSYIYRIGFNFFNIKPSGEILSNLNISYFDITITTFLSILFFIVLLILASKRYCKSVKY